MEVVLLAGGMGTRLHSVVSDLPKPMAPVNNKPFLEYIFQWIAKYPVSSVILSVGYKSEAISNYFGDYFQNIPLKYVKDAKPLGTGGAIVYALKAAADSDVIIINADTYFPVDINELVNFHKLKEAKLTVALKTMKAFDRYGTVELIGDTISRFNEKQFCEEGLINGGIYVVNKDFVNSMSLPEVFSFEKEILEKQADSGALKGLVFTEPFIDIGIPEDYYRASEIV